MVRICWWDDGSTIVLSCVPETWTTCVMLWPYPDAFADDRVMVSFLGVASKHRPAASSARVRARRLTGSFLPAKLVDNPCGEALAENGMPKHHHLQHMVADSLDLLRAADMAGAQRPASTAVFVPCHKDQIGDQAPFQGRSCGKCAVAQSTALDNPLFP